MSTRCNIILKLNTAPAIYLYRHHDGYLAETGANLHALLIAAHIATGGGLYSASGVANRFLRAVMTATYDQASHETEPKPIYELTDCVHGDIEHLYTIILADTPSGRPQPPQIVHAARPRHDGTDNSRWERRGTTHTLDTFAQAINADRRAMNRRLAELRTKHQAPDAWGDDYPMLTAMVAP